LREDQELGRLIKRATVLEAGRTGRPAAGLERGLIETFVLRVVLPRFACSWRRTIVSPRS
jgi:hypothetical protein